MAVKRPYAFIFQPIDLDDRNEPAGKPTSDGVFVLELTAAEAKRLERRFSDRLSAAYDEQEFFVTLHVVPLMSKTYQDPAAATAYVEEVYQEMDELMNDGE